MVKYQYKNEEYFAIPGLTRDPEEICKWLFFPWISAFAGMTTKYF
jgi:hypothetical protein